MPEDLWSITVAPSAFPLIFRAYEPDAAGHSLVELFNDDDVLNHLLRIDDEMKDHEAWQQEVLMFATGPQEIMRIAEPSFDLDYFQLRSRYASARLRAAFALRQDEVAYRPIDTAHCTEAARAAHYEAFLPLKIANPFDPQRMPGRTRPVRQEDGSLRDEWVVEFPIPQPNRPGAPIYFRPDFKPPAPLFRTMGAWWLVVATEEFAERVTRAGVTGIAFRQIEGDRAANEIIYRNR